MVTARSAAPLPAAAIAVLTEATLFEPFESPAEVLATAVFERFPAVLGKPTRVIVALAPGARSPRWAVTTPPEFETEPTLDDAETKVRPEGNASVSVAAVAVLLPLRLVTVIV